MTALLLALALAVAPGCPAALSRAQGLSDADLAGDAASLLQAVVAGGAGGPSTALAEEAGRGREPPRASKPRPELASAPRSPATARWPSSLHSPAPVRPTARRLRPSSTDPPFAVRAPIPRRSIAGC